MEMVVGCIIGFLLAWWVGKRDPLLRKARELREKKEER